MKSAVKEASIIAFMAELRRATSPLQPRTRVALPRFDMT
jgi:hypothetical protein